MESSRIDPHSPERQWLSVVGDLFLLGGCLGLVTWLLSSHDPLWLRLNPSPLILVPLLLGGRYGLVAGGVCGLLASGCGIVSAVAQGFGDWQTILHDNRYLLAALPVLGLVAGELRLAISRIQIESTKAILGLRESHLQATSALRVAEETSHRLERQLAAHGLEMVSLDNELAMILKAADSALFGEVLNVLYRITGLHEAAIYLPANGSGTMRRVAALDNGSRLPGSLPVDEAIVERALVVRDLVTCREIWGVTPAQPDRWIAALPWVDHCGNVRALLMVRRMALLSINWHSFDRMKTVCQWVTCCRLVRAGAAHALSDAEASMFQPARDEELSALRNAGDENFDRLRETIRLCVRGRDLHQLPTVGLCFAGLGQVLSDSGRMLTALSECLRPQDVCAPDPDSDNLIVLLPMMEPEGAKAIVGRILDALKRDWKDRIADLSINCSSTPLHAAESAEEFLKRLREGRR